MKISLGLSWLGTAKHAAENTRREMERRLLLDVVLPQSAAILEPLAPEDQHLLVRRDVLLFGLVLDLVDGLWVEGKLWW